MKFKNVYLGFTFFVPEQKDVLYKKVSESKAVAFRPGKASKKTTPFKANKRVVANF